MAAPLPPPTPSAKKEVSFSDTVTPLASMPKQPIRLGIQGAPGEGKTWAALTFPNPVILNLDNKLVGYQAANPGSKIDVINFTRDLCIMLGAKNGKDGRVDDQQWLPNVRDAVKIWLNKFGPILDSNRTLILDSWSSLQNRFDYQQELPHELSYSRSGEVDKFFFWRMKQKYAGEIMDSLKTLNCNVVVTFHETVERNEDGMLTGKLRPLMQGGFADQIAGQMTDFYRQIVVSRDAKNYENIKKALGRDIQGEREYLWQTQSNGIFTACCSIPNLPAFVPANFNSLVKA